MNKKFLYQLNGTKNGKLKCLLDNMNCEPRIAWHTSAGEDFRSLLYLSENHQNIYMGNDKPAAPDFFIYTDANSSLFERIIMREEDKFSDSKFKALLKDLADIGAWYLHEDERTKIKVVHYENLPDIFCPSDADIVITGAEEKKFRRVIFMHLLIESHLLGKFKLPLIYINAENESFCSRYAIGNVSFSHIIQVRYGGGLGGGGYASGSWILNVLSKLNTEIFISDGHLEQQSGDVAALSKYPNLRATESEFLLSDIYSVPSASWSCHGDVKWKRVTTQKIISS